MPPKKPKRPPLTMKPTPFRLPKRKGVVVYDNESKEAASAYSAAEALRMTQSMRLAGATEDDIAKNIELRWTIGSKMTHGPYPLEDSQRKGFERVFLATIYDGLSEIACRNEPSANAYPWNLRAISPGGCLDKALTFLLQPKYSNKHCRIYAHNGGKFDHLFLLYWLKSHDDEFLFEVASVQSKIQRLDIWRRDTPRKKLNWSFVDSLNLVKLDLATAAKTFLKDVELKQDFDLDTDEHSPLWEKYAIQDVRSVYYVLEKYHTLIESLGGEVGLTTPSTAVRLFQRRFLKEPILRHAHFTACKGRCEDMDCKRAKLGVCDGTCHGCLHAWIFEAYVGGRSEPYERRGTGLLYYDINSSYGRAMLEPMPVGKRIERENPTWKECKDLELCGYIGFLECTVEVPDACQYPPLPSKRGGKLVFVTGRFSGTWTLAELSLLSEPEVSGKVVRIRRAVFYEGKAVFAEMVNALYAYRDPHRHECEDQACKGCNTEFDPGLVSVAKDLITNHYGKYGMAAQRDACIYVPADMPEPENAEPLNGHYIDDPEKGEKRDVIWKVPYFVDVDYMIPQIAAYITSLARIRLYRGMLFVVRLGGKVYYVDTDAMVTDRKVATGTKLGQWKREQDYGKRLDGDFLLPKLYRLSQHDLDCVNDKCQGCAMVYHHPSCPKPKAAKAKDCKHCNRSASVQHMKGVPMRMQTSEVFAMFAAEDAALVSEKHAGTKRSGKTKQAAPRIEGIERVMQHRSILRSFGSSDEITGPRLVTASKGHRSTYDKRYMKEDGTSIPFRVWEDE